MKSTKRFLALPLYVQILMGMIGGILIGMLALYLGKETFIYHWIRPWGQVFIRLLQLIAIPLVFISLVKGITGLNDISKFSRMGGRTILLYIFTTTVAVFWGLSMGLIVKPGNLVDRSKVAEMQESYYAVVEQQKITAEQTQSQGPLAFLEEIIPNNIIHAAGDNSRMLQVIFFAVMFGIAALAISGEKRKPVMELFNSLNDIILKMVDFIIRIAPIGVLALMAGLVTDFGGDISIFSALAVYALTVIVALLALAFIFYPLLIHLFTRKKVKDYLKAIYPVQLFAFTTSSSAVTLPLTLETVEKDLHVSNEVASFVLPVGATINMDGTSCYQAVAVLFIAQVLGIELGFGQIMIIMAMTVLSSIGTPGIPGGSYVILTMVLTSVGIPAEGLALILGVDRPLDMMRTAVNVTGDTAVATMIDNQLNKNKHLP